MSTTPILHPMPIEDVLPAATRDALRHLEVFARRLVEGMLHGTHRSRRKGVSTEFDHHSMYQPGDPIKHVDWKASARHDRYYLKRYIEDTALTVRLVVDRSASMQMRTDGPTKYLQAARLAACLAYLIVRQRDSVALALTAGDETLWLPARSTEAHMVRILQALAASAPAAPDALFPCLKAVADRGERKGLVVVISDLMFDPGPVRRHLGALQAQGHEVLLFQLRDPTEEDFPFNRWVDFRDLENAAARHRLDTVPLKKIYLEEYRAWLDGWRAWCRKYDIHFVSCRTSDNMQTLLSEYIVFREGGAGKR